MSTQQPQEHRDKTVLVLGATGQQGGSVAVALQHDGWRVRALVRDANGPGARALARSGIEPVQGDLADAASLRRAMAGAYGVFSVQPSSGQGTSGVSDSDEVRFGVSVAEAAQASGVQHLVYSSSSAAGPSTGVGHFDSKWRVEEHVRSLDLDSTVVRPVTFMEMLISPDFGVASGSLTFFMRPDQSMQFIAVRDIGVLVALVFGDRSGFRGRSLEIAGDTVTGLALAALLGNAGGRNMGYRRFPESALADNPTLLALIHLVDEGPLAGRADLDALRLLHPGLLTVGAWLRGPGRAGLNGLGRAPAAAAAASP